MHAQRYRKAITGFDPAALQALVDHRWPGNVRELDHAVERAVLMAQGNVIHVADLGLRPRRRGDPTSRLEEMSLEEVEGVPHPEGDGALRQRQPRRQGARPEPLRAVPAPRTLPAALTIPTRLLLASTLCLMLTYDRRITLLALAAGPRRGCAAR